MQSVIERQMKQHASLETVVADYLKEQQFEIAEATYHKIYPKPLVALLQERITPTSMYLRHRADRIAVHRELEIEFEWECKTHASTHNHDMYIDVLPFIYHGLSVPFGVECLYIYRDWTDPEDPIECGFWTSDLPPIREVRIAPRFAKTRWLMETIEKGLPDSRRLFLREQPRGSGDPFVVFDANVVRKLPDWRWLIGERVNDELNRACDVAYEHR